ncbi:EamA family transporter RarD [Sporosarcina pasteurii]|uniref:Putative chloramphenical resistance permease RarD n=1 Tax=Sporosarcina pasteurii TaxID=1474 RepID=A0A380C5I7_SPOPA|nr:EamA family transporter RarD [Sporosarcina pasteurii]MDS9471756.1 EamA family transporter RarD [Sporosarcina pasteurii]QBQ04647.1 EamA family transporter RarD [Sporosarcina pasteurii]SUJ13161.1 putative chloramphenical resistance permease RarD [Sporosarcina pasteurii]
MNIEKSGVLWAISAYIIWGILPVYWKTLHHVSSAEILTSRIVWAFLLTLLLVLFMKSGRKLIEDLKTLWQSQKKFWSLFSASVLISANWFIYIWAVNHDHLVQTSLGYYMNPLVSVLLGVVFLKERLNASQKTAFLLAVIGVTILTISYGAFPWIAFVLAVTFAVYGLVKKTIKLDALRGLTIETFFITPIALAYYIWLFIQGEAAFLQTNFKTSILLILTGVVTALPLVLFAKGAQRMPLYMVGFLQYIAPTMMLFLGVIVYGETFGKIELLSFAFIWLALLLFTVSTLFETVRARAISMVSTVKR